MQQCAVRSSSLRAKLLPNQRPGSSSGKAQTPQRVLTAAIASYRHKSCSFLVWHLEKPLPPPHIHHPLPDPAPHAELVLPGPLQAEGEPTHSLTCNRNDVYTESKEARPQKMWG